MSTLFFTLFLRNITFININAYGIFVGVSRPLPSLMLYIGTNSEYSRKTPGTVTVPILQEISHF